VNRTRLTVGSSMITIGLLLFFLGLSLPFDIFRPGVTCIIAGVLVLVLRRPRFKRSR
jgi:hypothetical protein